MVACEGRALDVAFKASVTWPHSSRSPDSACFPPFPRSSPRERLWSVCFAPGACDSGFLGPLFFPLCPRGPEQEGSCCGKEPGREPSANHGVRHCSRARSQPPASRPSESRALPAPVFADSVPRPGPCKQSAPGLGLDAQSRARRRGTWLCPHISTNLDETWPLDSAVWRVGLPKALNPTFPRSALCGAHARVLHTLPSALPSSQLRAGKWLPWESPKGSTCCPAAG